MGYFHEGPQKKLYIISPKSGKLGNLELFIEKKNGKTSIYLQKETIKVTSLFKLPKN